MKHIDLTSMNALALSIAIANAYSATNSSGEHQRPNKRYHSCHQRKVDQLRLPQRLHDNGRSGASQCLGYRRGYCRRETALHRYKRLSTKHMHRQQDHRGVVFDMPSSRALIARCPTRDLEGLPRSTEPPPGPSDATLM